MSDTLELEWSNPSTYSDGTGVHHGYATAKATSLDALSRVGASLAPAAAWWAKVDPGGFIVPHVDKGPWRARWHYPESGDGYCWQEGETDDANFNPRGDTQYVVRHWEAHAVWNPFNEPRVVLIVEWGKPIDRLTTDLIICDMIPEIQTMIDAI